MNSIAELLKNNSDLYLICAGGGEFDKEEKAFGFAKGDVIVEGNLGFSSTNDKNTEEKTNSFQFNP